MFTAGGARLGTEQRYFRDPTAMSCRRLCISSFQDWTVAALNRSLQGLIDHVSIGNVSIEHLLEQLKATLQLSHSVATAWSDGATLDCAIAYNILLHQRDQALRGVSPLVSQDELECLRTGSFGASSLLYQPSYSCGTRWPVVNETMHYTGARLSCLKEVRRMKTGHRSLISQLLTRYSPLHDGECGKHSVISPSRHLGHFIDLVDAYFHIPIYKGCQKLQRVEWNHKLPLFVSPAPDPSAMGVDVLSLTHAGLRRSGSH